MPRRILLVACALGLAALGVNTANAPTAHAAATVHPYIVNGSQIPLSEVPYQVAVLDFRYGSDPASTFICGGSVLAPKLVITAGHCTYYDLGNGLQESASNLRVLVNTGNLSSGGTIVGVAAIHRNPGYDPTKSDRNDLALLTLDTAVGTTPATVVPPQSDYRWVNGTAGFVSGWGCDITRSDCRDQSDYPVRLRGASLTVHTNAYCEGRYNPYDIDFDPATMLCAGDPSGGLTAPGPCFGDSGGPLTVAGHNGQRLLIGLVSWGVMCGGESTAFTRVATYRSWLESYGVPITPPPLTYGPTRQLLKGATPLVGDFDGSGVAQVFAYRPGPAADVLYTNVSTGTASVPLNVSGTYRTAVCDQNGDGKDDMFFIAPGTAPDYVMYGRATPGTFVTKQIGAINSNYTPVVGDFNGDGACDLLLYQPGPGADHLWLADGPDAAWSDGPAINVSGNYTPIVGDFNGDGRADVLWYAPGTAPDYVRYGNADGTFSNGPAVAINGTYRPVTGDFNGDGHADILWYSPGAGIDSLWYGHANGFSQGPDVTVGGDYQSAVGRLNSGTKDDVAWVSASGAATLWYGN